MEKERTGRLLGFQVDRDARSWGRRGRLLASSVRDARKAGAGSPVQKPWRLLQTRAGRHERSERRPLGTVARWCWVGLHETPGWEGSRGPGACQGL